MDEMVVSDEVKRDLLLNQLQMWENSRYDALVQIEVAHVVEDEVMLEMAKDRLAKVLKAKELLLGMLEELKESSSDQGSGMP